MTWKILILLVEYEPIKKVDWFLLLELRCALGELETHRSTAFAMAGGTYALCGTREHLGCSWCHTSTWYYQNKHCYQITSEKQASTRKFLTFERICRLKFLVNPNLKYSPPSERLDASDPGLPPPFPEGRGDSCSSREHIFRRELSFQRPATTSEGGRQQGMPPAHRS